MDKIAFATLVAFVANRVDGRLDRHDVADLNDIVSELQSPPLDHPEVEKVRQMFNAMATNRKIDAIKAYRDLTGDGLKESKDAVESVMHRPPQPF